MIFNVFTIALDAMPWIKAHLPNLQATKLDWTWTIVEGVARPTKDTSWVKGITPRLSNDGTSEYLRSIDDKRVRVVQRERWENKTAMCNEALSMLQTGILHQVDADEIWYPEQLEKIHDLFDKNPSIGCARYWCNYWIGREIMATSTNGYGNRDTEWLRTWRFRRGQRFITHEPPNLSGSGYPIGRDQTADMGLVFDHFSWYTPEQVKAKCEYYGPPYSFEAWQRLQNNTKWPVDDLSTILPWVGKNARADKCSK